MTPAAALPHAALQARPRMVGILGGMGPAAGADFVRLFVEACRARMQALGMAVCDQAYPEHWLAQLPVPDRTAALDDPSPGAHQPGDALLQATGRLAVLGVQAVAMACNTAHAWHGLLQERFPQLIVLHMPREVAALLRAQGRQRVGLLATQGTYRSGLYRLALEHAKPGARYHAVAEEGVTAREIAEVVGDGLKVPVVSLTPEEAAVHFGWMARFITLDMPASSAWTRWELGWTPTGPSLIEDLEAMNYAA